MIGVLMNEHKGIELQDDVHAVHGVWQPFRTERYKNRNHPCRLGNHFSDLFDLRKTCDKEDFMEFDQKM